jgi:predicted RNase H-like HicB family nuclease
MTITLTFKLPCVIEKKEKWFVASCPAIDVVTQGETEEQAEKNLRESLCLFLTSCIERGTLGTVLKECGFKPVPGSTPIHPPRNKADTLGKKRISGCVLSHCPSDFSDITICIYSDKPPKL